MADLLKNGNDRYYAKFRVHPWSGITFTKSVIPQPTGRTKQKIISGLLDFYEAWKNQLEKSGQPYYLKIWLFEPRITQSQVVCAVGDNINFYDNTFFKSDKNEKINSEKYGHLKSRIDGLTWEHYLDEENYDNTTIGIPENYTNIKAYEEAKRWFQKLLKKPHRIYQFKEPIGDVTVSYSFRQGDVWLGG